MTNYERNPEKIFEAYKSGLISHSDFQKYLGVQGYKSELKKSLVSDSISESTYSEEFGKASSFFFEKDQTRGILRFVLKGTDFQPLDLKKHDLIWKSMQSKPIQSLQPERRRVTGTGTLISKVNEVTEMAKRQTEIIKSKQSQPLQASQSGGNSQLNQAVDLLKDSIDRITRKHLG